MNKLRVIFMGTPAFSVPCLALLAEREDVEVCGVVTQTDKEKGRGYQLLPPPVKVFAAAHGLEVYQPATLKDESFFSYLEKKAPDLIVVVAYGKILPARVIHYPKYGCINVHASLLPKYRGAAPIHWCLINGDKVTGVTTMQMDEGVDTGDMLEVEKLEILEEDTTGTLFEKLAQTGRSALSRTLDKVLSNSLQPIKQDEAAMVYAPMISKEFSYIDWNQCAEQVCNLIRGLNPFPGAKTKVEGKMVKLLFAQPAGPVRQQPGTVVEGTGRLVIACGEGSSLEVLRLQPEGKKPMEAGEYLRGHQWPEGIKLG